MRRVSALPYLPLIISCIALVVFGLERYPLNPFLLGSALLAYAAIIWRNPESWLLFIPAILPIANFSTLSGWLFFEELDFFVLVTVAVGYWRLMPKKPVYGFSSPVLLLLLAASYGISAYVGLMPFQKLDANAFSNYFSHYNSLRIFKPFVWALLLLPLLKRTEGGLLVPGILTGLAFVSLAAIWERWTFTGLMNFASDYRITAPFPEMHTGGAALDAFLSLSLPFSLFYLFRGRHAGIALVLFAAASYTVFATFSRGLYLGFAVSVAAMGFFLLRGDANRGDANKGRRLGLPMATLSLVALILLVKTFDAGGYRGLFAAICLMAATYFIGGTRSVSHGKAAIGAAAFMLGLVCVVLIVTFGKGSYLAFGLSATVCTLGFALHEFWPGNLKRAGMMFASAGFLAMGPCDLAVNWHWGGDRAAIYGGLVWVFAMTLALGNRSMKDPLWSWSRNGARALALGLMLSGMAIPVLWNPYMNDRVEEAHSDLDVRMSHWRGVLEMIDTDWKSRLFGMGLGRFPETFFWRNGDKEQPSTYRFGIENGSHYLRLNGSSSGWDGGNYLRFDQRVDIRPFRNYTAEFLIRTAFPGQRVDVEICEKLLLYPMDCSGNLVFPNPDGKWHSYTMQINSGTIGSEPWYRRPAAQFFFGNGSKNGYLDIGSVSLKDGAGNLIRNGNFTRGFDRWFFSSDRYHLPWHEKNLFLHICFDQGLFGLEAFGLLSLYALLALMRRAVHGDFLAAALLASLLSFFAVGLFDSILDFPRLSLLFYLMLFSSLLSSAAPRSAAENGIMSKRRKAK